MKKYLSLVLVLILFTGTGFAKKERTPADLWMQLE